VGERLALQTYAEGSTYLEEPGSSLGNDRIAGLE